MNPIQISLNNYTFGTILRLIYKIFSLPDGTETPVQKSSGFSVAE